MHQNLFSRFAWKIRFWLLCVAVLSCAAHALGQPVCVGDLDGDGFIGAGDLALLRELMFDEERTRLLGYLADANDDAAVSAADLVALLRRFGARCSSPTTTPRMSATPTPTATSSPTRLALTPSPSSPTSTATPTPTRTATPTPSLTPTPTAVCTVQRLTADTAVDGTLAAGDCERLISGTRRVVDAYELAATPGRAIRIEVSNLSGGFTAPWIAVVDSNGQFGFGQGRPPVEWTAVEGQPYLVYVTSDLDAAQQLGGYRLRVTSRPCPTPRAINLSVGFSLSNLRLSSADCADPVSFATDGRIDPTHTYTFQVTNVPTQVDIVMRQLIESDPLDPTLVLLGPDGVEVVPADQMDDAAGGPLGVDAGARFLAIRPGTYTLIAGGGEGRYSLVVTSPRCPTVNLSNIPSDRPLVCSGQSGPGCQGTLYGSRASGTCAAPLPVFSDEEAPVMFAGGNAYTFTGQRGELFSVGVEVDGDDGYALLLGPSSAGNPIVAYDSSVLSGYASTQLSAPLTQTGTYTLLLGNVSPLNGPDPSVGDPGDVLPYRYYVQKCLPAGVILPGAAQTLTSSFRVMDCLGSGQTPHRIYIVPGQPGQFLTVEMEGDDGLDPALRLWAPDGSVTENEQDPFGNVQVARVSRLLQEGGDYLLEVYASPTNGEFDFTGSNVFKVRARSCPTQELRPGIYGFGFDGQDCQFPSGQKYKVLTWQGGAVPQVASFSASDGVCMQALLPNGETVPAYSCASGLLEVPMVREGNYALVIVSEPGEVQPSFVLSFRQCGLARTVTFGDKTSGSLGSTSCQAADGARGDWYWITAGENLLRFNQGIGGTIESTFQVLTALTDLAGTIERSHVVSADPETMFHLPRGNRSALLRLRSTGPSGAYTLAIDPATKRQ